MSRRPDPPILWLMLGFAVALVIALAILAVVVPQSYGARVTEASQNVRDPNPRALIRADIAAAMRHSSLIRLQESYGKGDHEVRVLLARHPVWREARGARHTELGILWNTRVWTALSPAHVRLVAAGHRHGPWRRWIVWVTLQHRGTGQVVTVANVHADPHGCWHRSPVFERAVSTYLRAVAHWTQQQQRAHQGRSILLGGDLNCYVPRVLRPWYRTEAPGRGGWGADHLLTARGSAVTTVRRWHRGAHSDHDLELRTMRLG